MRRVIRVLFLPIVFAVSAGVGFSRGSLTSPARAADAEVRTGDERLLVYVGSSTCDFSNVEEIPRLVNAIRERVRASAESRRFVMVGIAKDQNVTAGLKHLAKVASFDEVMTGRSWANIGVLKYVYSDLRGVAATPEVVVVDRRLINDQTGTRVENETVIVRAAGLNGLRDLASGKISVTEVTGQDSASRPAPPSADADVPKGR